jgi:hypothetical protein
MRRSNQFAGRTQIHCRQNAAGETASLCALHRTTRAGSDDANEFRFRFPKSDASQQRSARPQRQPGNDGNAATFWQANAADSNAWWSVDLERMVTVSQTKLTFPAEANWRYRIEISNDGSTGWKA